MGKIENEKKTETKNNELKAPDKSNEQLRRSISARVDEEMRAQLSPSARQLYDLIYKDQT